MVVKSLIICLPIFLLNIYSFAQNAKIMNSPNGTVISNSGGTDIPNSSSILDVRSNNKGVLLPRTSSDLASPVEGLFYYNTTGHNFRYYNGTAWQNAFFGNQWNTNGTSISYSAGNVGIGTDSPLAKLSIFQNSTSIIPAFSLVNKFNNSTNSNGFSEVNSSLFIDNSINRNMINNGIILKVNNATDNIAILATAQNTTNGNFSGAYLARSNTNDSFGI